MSSRLAPMEMAFLPAHRSEDLQSAGTSGIGWSGEALSCTKTVTGSPIDWDPQP